MLTLNHNPSTWETRVGVKSSELTWTTLQNPAFKEGKGRERKGKRKEKGREGEREGERREGEGKKRKGKEGEGEGRGRERVGGGKEVGNRRKVGRQVIPCQLGPDFRTSA